MIGLGTTQCADHDECWNRFRVDYSYADPSYSNNDNGNVMAQTITVPDLSGYPVATMTQVYDYDELNRLKSATEAGVITPCRDQSDAVIPCWKQTFSYDRFGNRRFDQSAGATTFPVIDAANLTLTNPQLSPSNNRISEAGYEYDAAGNLKCDPERSCNPTTHAPYYEYDAENKLVKNGGGASPNDATAASYFYDGDGRRVKKAVGSGYTIFVYDALGQMVAEYDTAGASGGGTSYLTEDNLGTPRVITDKDGTVTARHDYAPFGEELVYNQSLNLRGMDQQYVGDKLRQKFTQKERDIETGLDYFDARYYSSSQGRFTSPDEFTGGPDELFTFAEDASANPTFYADIRNPQSLNKYQYAFNNPLRYVDPDGHDAGDTDPQQEGKTPVAVPLPAPVPLPPIIVPTQPVQPAPNPFTAINNILDSIVQPIINSEPGHVTRQIVGRDSIPNIGPNDVPPVAIPNILPDVTLPPSTGSQPAPPPAPIHTRAKNKMKPVPTAQGPHTTLKKDPTTGKITGYETWVPNPRNPGGFDSRKRVDVAPGGAPHKGVPTPHVHDKRAPGGIRPARKNELP